MLDGKRILVTGVLTRHSIAYAVADFALRNGADVLLTSFGRMRRMTERSARSLPGEPEVLELDVTSDEDLGRISGEVDSRWGRLDGLVHAIANAPPDAVAGNFLETPTASAQRAFEVSAYSLKALAVALLPLFDDERGGSIVGLDFDASVAWPGYDWMGVSKAALESVNRYLAAYLGPRRIRSNLVSAGPIQTAAASVFPDFGNLAASFASQAPMLWDAEDAAQVAEPVCFLLSEHARSISGEILHVDGGFHAVGRV